MGFEGLRASQLHVQPRTQQNRAIVLRGGGGGGGGEGGGGGGRGRGGGGGGIQDCFSSEVPPLSVA